MLKNLLAVLAIAALLNGAQAQTCTFTNDAIDTCCNGAIPDGGNSAQCINNVVPDGFKGCYDNTPRGAYFADSAACETEANLAGIGPDTCVQVSTGVFQIQVGFIVGVGPAIEDVKKWNDCICGYGCGDTSKGDMSKSGSMSMMSKSGSMMSKSGSMSMKGESMSMKGKSMSMERRATGGIASTDSAASPLGSAAIAVGCVAVVALAVAVAWRRSSKAKVDLEWEDESKAPAETAV